MNVLVIEDDKRIANLFERALREDGPRVSLSHNGREGADMILAGKHDVALLDILLPEMDGFQILKRVRDRHCKMPVLVLTAVDAVPKILHAFDLGADDYLVKPFILEILLARVSAIARRVPSIDKTAICASGVTLDHTRRVATRHEKEIPLTRKQFALLETLTGLVLFGLMSFAALRYALLQGKKTHLQGREDRLISLLKENKANGVAASLDEQLRNYALVTHEGNLVHIYNPDGSILFPLDSKAIDWPLSLSEDCTKPTFSSVVLEHQPALVMCHMILLDGRLVRLHVGGSLEEETYILEKYRNALLLLMPGLLILSSVSGYFLSRHAMRPVDRMT